MRFDLALNLFGADLSHVVQVARLAEAAGVDGLWVPDHFSGAVVDAQWSRDPLVALGALAVSTDRVRLGPLVANVRNRHAAQLASAANSLASLAPDRTVLGIGSGAAPGSRFAVEHEAIGTELGDVTFRRGLLVDHIETVRRLHREATERLDGTNGVGDGRLAVTDGAPPPPVVVGASARSTVEVAIDHADGVNLRAGASVDELIDVARRSATGDFEISVLVGTDVARPDVDRYRDRGVDRVVVGVDLHDGGSSVPGLLERFGLG